MAATRWFLATTGYPKVGGGDLHVAHMLWGGLLLVVAATLPLLFVGRKVLLLSALAAGVGIGLFIDEIGKFITEAGAKEWLDIRPRRPAGGQVLLSRSVRAALTDASPFQLRSLGSYRLRGISDEHDLYQLVATDLLDTFPPLRLSV